MSIIVDLFLLNLPRSCSDGRSITKYFNLSYSSGLRRWIYAGKHSAAFPLEDFPKFRAHILIFTTCIFYPAYWLDSHDQSFKLSNIGGLDISIHELVALVYLYIIEIQYVRMHLV